MTCRRGNPAPSRTGRKSNQMVVPFSADLSNICRISTGGRRWRPIDRLPGAGTGSGSTIMEQGRTRQRDHCAGSVAASLPKVRVTLGRSRPPNEKGVQFINMLRWRARPPWHASATGAPRARNAPARWFSEVGAPAETSSNRTMSSRGRGSGPGGHKVRSRPVITATPGCHQRNASPPPIGVLVLGPSVRERAALNYKQPYEEEWLGVRWSVLEQGPLLVDAKSHLARERRSRRSEAGGPAGPRSGPAARERQHWRPIRGSKEMRLPRRLLAGYSHGWSGHHGIDVCPHQTETKNRLSARGHTFFGNAMATRNSVV
jgi:hypothetical protein